MTKHFHRDLERLHQEVLAMAAQVEDLIDQANRVLFEGEADKASAIIASDDAIDRREVLIEEECLKMLALHQPVAIDLRRIATVLKVNRDLERIADLAVKIASRARKLHERPDFLAPPKLKQIFHLAKRMLRDALNAFVEYNTRLAREVRDDDDAVDQLYREVTAETIALMESRSDFVAPGLQLLSVARHLERIADHATSIAEDVIYLVEGEIVRHRHGVP